MIHELKRTSQVCPHCGHYQQTALGTEKGQANSYQECLICCRNIHSHLEINEYRQQVQMLFSDDPGQVF